MVYAVIVVPLKFSILSGDQALNPAWVSARICLDAAVDVVFVLQHVDSACLAVPQLGSLGSPSLTRQALGCAAHSG